MLIPAIQALMAQAGLRFAELDAIAFGCGPGSFTGLRTACAVAQGLAFGANLKVLPVATLLAVAEEARYQQADALAQRRVQALLDARMDEMYTSNYDFDSGQWTQNGGCSLIKPEDLKCLADCTLAGNVFAGYGARLPGTLTRRFDAWPTATAILRLAPALLAAGGALPAAQALPFYVRDKVAQTMMERSTQKAAS
jgi:tRNA threonylcarbamoyladenosine biosynthesis protein TsaB